MGDMKIPENCEKVFYHIQAATENIIEVFKILIPEADEGMIAALTVTALEEVLNRVDQRDYTWKFELRKRDEE